MATKKKYNNEVRLIYIMKVKSILAVLAISAVLFSCDPGHDAFGSMKNNSSSEVKVVSPRFNVTIAPGDEYNVGCESDMGFASKGACARVFRFYFSDSVSFIFVTGDTVVFHETDTTGLSPYNFKSSAYSYEEKTEKFPKGDPSGPCYAKLTYNITADIIPSVAD